MFLISCNKSNLDVLVNFVLIKKKECILISGVLCRNDIDRVGVRPGCNLTMWSGDDYTGQVGSWTESDRWGAGLGIYSEL